MPGTKINRFHLRSWETQGGDMDRRDMEIADFLGQQLLQRNITEPGHFDQNRDWRIPLTRFVTDIGPESHLQNLSQCGLSALQFLPDHFHVFRQD